MRDKDIHASEEFAREDSGEKGDEPRIQDHKSNRNISQPEYFPSISRWVVLFCCLLSISELHTFPVVAY